MTKPHKITWLRMRIVGPPVLIKIKAGDQSLSADSVELPQFSIIDKPQLVGAVTVAEVLNFLL